MAYLLWQLPELGGPNSSASLLSSAATAPGVMSSVKCSSSWKALVGQGSVFKQKFMLWLVPRRLGLPGSIKHCRLWYLLFSCAVCCRSFFLICNLMFFFGQCVLHSASRYMQKGTSPVICTSSFSRVATLGKDLTPSRSTSCTWKSCRSKFELPSCRPTGMVSMSAFEAMEVAPATAL